MGVSWRLKDSKWMHSIFIGIFCVANFLLFMPGIPPICVMAKNDDCNRSSIPRCPASGIDTGALYINAFVRQQYQYAVLRLCTALQGQNGRLLLWGYFRIMGKRTFQSARFGAEVCVNDDSGVVFICAELLHFSHPAYVSFRMGLSVPGSPEIAGFCIYKFSWLGFDSMLTV